MYSRETRALLRHYLVGKADLATRFGISRRTVYHWIESGCCTAETSCMRTSPTLPLTLTDTITNASFTTSTAINIPATVGANTAYVGFTADTGGLTATRST